MAKKLLNENADIIKQREAEEAAEFNSKQAALEAKRQGEITQKQKDQERKQELSRQAYSSEDRFQRTKSEIPLILSEANSKIFDGSGEVTDWNLIDNLGSSTYFSKGTSLGYGDYLNDGGWQTDYYGKKYILTELDIKDKRTKQSIGLIDIQRTMEDWDRGLDAPYTYLEFSNGKVHHNLDMGMAATGNITFKDRDREFLDNVTRIVAAYSFMIKMRLEDESQLPAELSLDNIDGIWKGRKK
ncbi:MAG: hypothetical protein UT39_C0012G0023 [Candidatus Woesebacteria bacterium GW2011_GWA1_39_21]|uniref:Uncharacterized protein n=1 Tax=Candidatus Woesebacteria bacterium GW2011_GWA1_39_21 TaxID=1618550 RepID=A0A0G0NDV4_9BACT|nr:MAG: hypothetical protein UT39_C0012G0023 [Candidatus Woesebacteria bacterium GW2011_GWA1_39_21]